MNWFQNLVLTDLKPQDSLLSTWLKVVEQYADQVCMIQHNSNYHTPPTKITHQQLHNAVAVYSHYLSNTLHIGKNDKILYFSDISTSDPLMLFSSMAIGATLVIVTSKSYNLQELTFIFNHIQPKYIIATNYYQSFFQNQQVLSKFKFTFSNNHKKDRIVFIPDFFSLVQKQSDDINIYNLANCCKTIDGENDLILIQYTTGTTGGKKGCMLTHHNILTSIYCYESCRNKKLSKHCCVLNNMSIDAISGILNVLSTLLVGHILVLYPNFKKVNSQPLLWSKLCKLYNCEQIILFGREMESLLEECDNIKGRLIELRNNLSSLRVISFGGSQIPLSIICQFISKLLANNASLYYGYGMSEIGCQFTSYDIPQQVINFVKQNNCIAGSNRNINASDFIDKNRKFLNKHLTTIGHCFNGTIARINDKTKELELQTPGIMKGYWKMPQLTKETIISDSNGNYNNINNRWIKTGDCAKIDSKTGNIYILGRVKDLIILPSGKHVYPTLMQNIMIQSTVCNQFIQDCIVIGLPYNYIDSTKQGDLSVAFVKLKNECDGKENLKIGDLLHSACLEYVIQNKEYGLLQAIPISFIFLKSFPKNRNNKIDKIALKSMLAVAKDGDFEKIELSPQNKKNIQHQMEKYTKIVDKRKTIVLQSKL